MRYHDGSGHQVSLKIDVDGRQIICRVSEEYLSDTYAPDLSGVEVLDIAKEHFDEITDLWGHKITNGQFEKDGSVLIRSI